MRNYTSKNFDNYLSNKNIKSFGGKKSIKTNKNKTEKKKNFDPAFRKLFHDFLLEIAPSDIYSLSYALKAAGMINIKKTKEIAGRFKSFNDFLVFLKKFSQDSVRKETQPGSTKKGVEALKLFLVYKLNLWTATKTEKIINKWINIEYCGIPYIWDSDTHKVYYGTTQTNRIEVKNVYEAVWTPDKININDYNDMTLDVENIKGVWKWNFEY